MSQPNANNSTDNPKDYGRLNADKRENEPELTFLPPVNMHVDLSEDASPTDPSEAGSAQGLQRQDFDGTDMA